MEKKQIIELINDAARSNIENSFRIIGFPNEPMWSQPIVGFAAGDDPIFSAIKEEIGDFYLMPSEVFKIGYPAKAVQDKDLTVISVGFPQTDVTKKEQQGQTEYPGRRWQITRNTWTEVVKGFYYSVIERFKDYGLHVVGTDILPGIKKLNSDKHVYASNWSHRHTAMAAGLGTFGLSEGLITEKGKAMRFATLIMEGVIPADERKYQGIRDWCSFYADGSCGACIKRCPAGAITEKGHDKMKCSNYLMKMQERSQPDPAVDSSMEVGCGLCQSKVPCENRIPVKVD